MKLFWTTAALATALVSGMAMADDATIPWADNSGGTQSTHIAAMGENLNAQHQQVTQTGEGEWAKNSGSIQADEAVLNSGKPPVKGDPGLAEHGPRENRGPPGHEGINRSMPGGATLTGPTLLKVPQAARAQRRQTY